MSVPAGDNAGERTDAARLAEARKVAADLRHFAHVNSFVALGRIAETVDALAAELVKVTEREREAVEALRSVWDGAFGCREKAERVLFPERFAAAHGDTPEPEHPCPAGDDCALNKGARTCKHCGRNWPPDETWAAPVSVPADDPAGPTLDDLLLQPRHADDCVYWNTPPDCSCALAADDPAEEATT